MIGPVAMVLVVLLAAGGDTICASSVVEGFLLEVSSDIVNALCFRGKIGTFESQVLSSSRKRDLTSCQWFCSGASDECCG